MKNIRIKLPLLLNANAYFGLVLLIILSWAFSETIREAKGFAALVIIICPLMSLNGIANILLEKEEDYSNIYRIKDKSKILSSSNGVNYISLFIFLPVSGFWLSKQPPAGPIISLIILIPLFIAICFVLIVEIKTMFNNGFNLSSIFIGFAFLFYMLGTWTKDTIANSYGEKRLGSFFEKNKYITRYYVNLFPNKDSAKNYRLPADIYVHYEEHESDESSSTVKYIHIEKAYFPNGGFITFNNEDSENTSLKFGEKIWITDYQSKDWYVELTDEKVE